MVRETVEHLLPLMWPMVVMKELFIGSILGLMFGAVFWAIGMAGGIVDTQVGANMANAVDPIQGHQTTLNGVWLSRFASLIFMSSGGFFNIYRLTFW
jgi:type III secretion protein T